MVQQSIVQLLKRLWRCFDPRRRGQFGLLLAVMMLSSLAEIVSIGAVLPFLGVLMSPERIFDLPMIQPFIQVARITKPDQLLLPLTIAFGIAALIAGGVRLFLLWATTKVSFAAGNDLSISVYFRTLYQPYEVHCMRNSSEVIAGISSKANGVIWNTILPVLTIISASIMLIAILLAMMLIDPLITFLAFGGFGVLYAVIIGITRKRLLVDSEVMARESVSVIKSLQEGLGGIRDVLIDGSQASYCDIYRKADLSMRSAQARSFFIAGSPRFSMESMGLVLISLLAYMLSKQPDGIEKAIPVLGAIALGAQRLLPVLQQIYSSWVTVRGGHVSLQETLELLEQPLPEYSNQPDPSPLSFNQNITLKEISFRYSPQGPYVLKKIDLNIAKGSRIGFIGATGSGKSTLLDIIMGLLNPTDGALLIDDKVISAANNRSWQSHIAHVPQAIFLADSTIEENIAFGVPNHKIDFKRVLQAAHQAQISKTIESWPKQYQTFVGERGIRLSGGQRQRIGIARALYKRADVIIFDEATSALDSETEEAVMQAIEGLSKDLTLLIIAHRLTTLKNCTHIVELGEGEIQRIGSYEEIVNKYLDSVQAIPKVNEERY
jgi:ATP-binding cassette subfamily B protein